MYYIYAYIDPRSNLPFYIGKGKGDRKFDHLNQKYAKKENREKSRIIQEIIDTGLRPIITELENNILDEEIAYNREDFYILQYGRKGYEPFGILTNKTINGKHPPVPVWDEKRKQKHREFNKKYWTPEARLKHSINNVGNGIVNVRDKQGQLHRISKVCYDSMDKTLPISEWEYVFVASNEAKRRKQLLDYMP